MREIKFRAWNGTSMTDVGTGYFSNAISYGSKPVEWVDSKDWPLMQYTGLKDKNGKEVFESDVVSDHVGIGVVEYKSKYAGFRVNYKDGQCKWFYDYILNGERESIEVIGNIWEDSHLLNENKE